MSPEYTRYRKWLYIYIYIYIYICIFVCLWGDYFHEQGVKLQIANMGNGHQAPVRTTLKVVICRNGQGKLLVETMTQPPSKISLLID